MSTTRVRISEPRSRDQLLLPGEEAFAVFLIPDGGHLQLRVPGDVMDCLQKLDPVAKVALITAMDLLYEQFKVLLIGSVE